MAKKQIIRITEGDLHNIIKESVNKILKEAIDFDAMQNQYGDANSYQGEDETESFDFGHHSPYREELMELLKTKNQDYYGYWIYARNSDLGQIKRMNYHLYSIGTNDGGKTIDCIFMNNDHNNHLEIDFDELNEKEQQQILDILRAL